MKNNENLQSHITALGQIIKKNRKQIRYYRSLINLQKKEINKQIELKNEIKKQFIIGIVIDLISLGLVLTWAISTCALIEVINLIF